MISDVTAFIVRSTESPRPRDLQALAGEEPIVHQRFVDFFVFQRFDLPDKPPA